jgi:hypothetical protein
LEDGAVAVYHSFANGRLYHMEGGEDEDEDEDEVENEDAAEPGALFFEPEAGPALEVLVHGEDAADGGVVVSELPPPETTRVDIVKRLVAAGVLAVVK